MLIVVSLSCFRSIKQHKKTLWAVNMNMSTFFQVGDPDPLLRGTAPVSQHWYLVFIVRVPLSLTKENRRELYLSTCSLLF
jgi:hypothetical protein